MALPPEAQRAIAEGMKKRKKRQPAEDEPGWDPKTMGNRRTKRPLRKITPQEFAAGKRMI
jgi:hypothetical protein